MADEPFPKALQSLEACLLVNDNWCGKLFSLLESPVTFDESVKVRSVSCFIPDFKLLSCELENVTFKDIIIVKYYIYYIKVK